MNRTLDILSLIGSFLIAFGVIYLALELSFGQVQCFRQIIVFKVIHLKDLIFTAVTLLLILKFVDFYLPKRKEN